MVAEDCHGVVCVEVVFDVATEFEVPLWPVSAAFF